MSKKVKKESNVKLAIKIVCISLASLLFSGGVSTAIVFYTAHNVKLNSNCLEIANSTLARLVEDYKCSFKIKDDVIKTRYMDNINVYSVKVNGREIPPSAYSFIYQTNQKNEFSINRKYLNGNIEINVDLIKKTSKQNCFYFGYYLEDECNLDFANMEVLYPTKIGTNNALDKAKTKDKDLIYLQDNYDAARINKGELPLGLNFPAIVAREDNMLVLKFTGKNGNALPKNIWYNTNARFALKGEEFTIVYSNNNKQAIMTIPYFAVHDSGFIQLNPNEEA